MQVSFSYNGKNYANFEDVDAVAAGVPEDVVKQALLDQAWSLVRAERDRRIAETDYAMTADYPLTEEQKAELTAYRQALRDIPQGFDSPDAIDWPTKPEFLV